MKVEEESTEYSPEKSSKKAKKEKQKSKPKNSSQKKNYLAHRETYKNKIVTTLLAR